MDDILNALKAPAQEINEEGVLNNFMHNAMRILRSGLAAATLLTSVATLHIDMPKSSLDDPLVLLVMETESLSLQHIDDLSARLTSFMSLKAGWNNDELSQPINSDVVDFIKRTMQGTDATDWQKWMAFPEQTGSVLLDYEADNCHASISVGTDGFSYMAYGEGFYDTADRCVLSERELLSFVRRVKQYGRS